MSTVSQRRQAVSLCVSGGKYRFIIPGPEEQVMPGVRWGSAGQLFSPAYWSIQVFLAEFRGYCTRLQLGQSFVEEVVACLLGGHGIKAEIGLAAFSSLKDQGLLSGEVFSTRAFAEALKIPLIIKGRRLQYRFAAQKAKFIHQALSLLALENPPHNPLELRNWLLQIPGIGFKTASWITRNWTGSDSVAIIDIHIWRAGRLIGLFHDQRPERNYVEMESLFVRFASGIHMRTSTLDAVIWSQMKSCGYLAKGEVA